ncbi:MAG: hypothetical protein Q9170_006070 [Blastenia crenularia]
MIQDLQRSGGNHVGVAYFYFGWTRSTMVDVLRFWIIQLALQCQCLPFTLSTGDLTDEEVLQLGEIEIPWVSGWPRYEKGLLSTLLWLLPIFRRTFLLIDGIDVNMKKVSDYHTASSNTIIKLLHSILEQDHGDVSIATFARVTPPSLLEIADVSIRLAQLKPDLNQYSTFKIQTKVKPTLADAHLGHDGDLLSNFGSIISETAHGLYLGVDVIIGSLLITFRKGIDIILRRTREDNKIMLQIDPESMKQKAFGIDTLTPLEQAAGRKALPSNKVLSSTTAGPSSTSSDLAVGPRISSHQ